MAFEYVAGGNRWADAFGYSRAVRAGQLIFVTGTAPVADDGSCYAPGDAYAQTLRCFEIIERALRELGADRAAIVRSRVFVTDMSFGADVGRAHATFFGGVAAPGGPAEQVHRPCLTMVGIGALVDPQMLVEIECDAVATS